MKNFPFPYLGSISSGTLRTEDLLPEFLDVLRKLGGTLSRGDANKVRRILDREEWSDEDREWCDELLHEELFNKLGCFAPDYCYFGATEGDGADFGFWISSDWEERARENGIPFVSDTGEVPKDERACIQVSDHGNATYYVRRSARSQWREVWSVV